MSRVVWVMFVCSVAACAEPLENKTSQIDEFNQTMKVWDFESKFGPVYFGSIRDYNDRTKLDSCLALAFMQVEGDRVHYIHKLWPPKNSSCDFGDITSQVEGLKKPRCFTDAPATDGTRAMTPEALAIAVHPEITIGNWI